MRLRVLHVVRPANGGLRRHVDLLLPALAAAGCDVQRVGLGRIRERPDLIHAHGYTAALWARQFTGPRLATGHTLPGLAIGDRSAYWLAVSHAVAAALRARGVPEQRLAVLPGACRAPTGVSPAMGRRALGIGDRTPVVAYVGRLVAGKGLDVLIAALARLPGTVLLVAGAGPLRLPVSDRLRLLGHVSDPEPVYAAADVVCLPSQREGLGLVVLEAMACGRPVVATATGGIPDLVLHGVNGLLVPPGDVAALAAALGRLLASPAERERLGRAGRRLAEGRTVEALAAAVLAAYAEVLR